MALLFLRVAPKDEKPLCRRLLLLPLKQFLLGAVDPAMSTLHYTDGYMPVCFNPAKQGFSALS
jgi:hypothetical protein